MAAFLMILISASLSLADHASPNTAQDELLLRGWQHQDRIACKSLLPGHFYEAGNEESSVEILALKENDFFVSKLPLPEEPYECHPITAPHFIEEIP